MASLYPLTTFLLCLPFLLASALHISLKTIIQWRQCHFFFSILAFRLFCVMLVHELSFVSGGSSMSNFGFRLRCFCSMCAVSTNTLLSRLFHACCTSFLRKSFLKTTETNDFVFHLHSKAGWTNKHCWMSFLFYTETDFGKSGRSKWLLPKPWSSLDSSNKYLRFAMTKAFLLMRLSPQSLRANGFSTKTGQLWIQELFGS